MHVVFQAAAPPRHPAAARVLRSGHGWSPTRSRRASRSSLALARRSPAPPAAAAIAAPSAADARDDRQRLGAAQQGPDRAASRAPVTGSRCASDPTSSKPIRVGDRLRASAEVQVSTTCVENGPRCIGRSYEVNPTITAQDRALAEPRRPTRGVPAAVREPQRALQAAAPEPQPPLHDRDPEHRDVDQRPLGPALPARRLLREPDRRRHRTKKAKKRRRRRARRRPPRRLGRAGQGPAERRPGALERAGADGESRASSWSTPSCR